jgi:diguanylate cyclase (GGDEF)-like protein/PAS domain S-box-containing protein
MKDPADSDVELRLLREAFELASVGLVAVSPDGTFRAVNDAFCRMCGYTRQELEGRSYAGMVRADDLVEDEAHLARVRAGAEPPPRLDTRFVHKTGAEIWVRVLSNLVRDADGSPRFIVAAVIDLSDSKQAEEELHKHLHFSRALLDAIPSPVYFKDRGGNYPVYNRAWEELVGPEAMTGSMTVHKERDRGLLERPSSTTYEAAVQTNAGDARQMLFNKVSFVDQEGAIAGLIGVITDVTRYKETERALETSEARFRVLTESSMDLISVVDEEGYIVYQSPALRHLIGYEPGETIGKNVFDMIHRDDLDEARSAFRRVIEKRRSSRAVEFRIRHRDGMWRTFESLGTNCLGNPHIRGVVFNSREITDRKMIEQRIQHLAYHDNLTGLPNRSLLQDRLAHSVQRAERAGKKVAVLFIDLDNFKNINDTLGHDVGDELLRQVSRRLAECIRLEDTIARQGGDEFIILLDNIEEGHGASLVAQKVLNTLRQPFPIGGNEQHVSGSLGIALYPEDGADAQTLLKSADTAMFHGKSLGKNTYQFFTPQMNVAVKRRLLLETALRRAVIAKSFVLHYQPQINLETGEIVAVEALVRWRSEDGGTVLPGEFIAVAEETGLINEVGEWVLREGCRQAKAWQTQGHAPRRMAINLSARQFGDKGFLEMVTRVLEETGLEPRWLELELTESQVMRQTEGVIDILNRLSAMGIHLAIDDFGTGYSSLSYLKRLPIQTLKIDQSFVRDITVDPNDTAIVVAIINMARSLELDTIAEGVETAGQLALLRSKGCRVGQGFYFSRAVDADTISEMMRVNNAYARAPAPSAAD